MHLWRIDLADRSQPARRFFGLGALKCILAAALLLICSLALHTPQAKASPYPAGGRALASPPADLAQFETAWMIGDSQTAPFSLLDLFAGMDIEHEIGMSLQLLNRSRSVRFEGEALTVNEKIARKKPSALYIWLGSNGIDRTRSEDILLDYETFLKTIRADFPNLPLFCVSATPVLAKARERYPRYTQQKILNFNEGLLALCKSYGAVYLDFHQLLVGEDGSLQSKYAAGDGIHLNYKTYDLLKDYLLRHSSGAVMEE